MVMVVLAAVLGGCGRRSPAAAPEDTAPQAEWSLTVINRHSLDVTIHVVTDGQQARVGSVGATQTQSFVLPARMVGPGRTVRLEAGAIGSPHRARSESLVVRYGQHVEWVLENGLRHGSVAIW
jgi:hypothetical protein